MSALDAAYDGKVCGPHRTLSPCVYCERDRLAAEVEQLEASAQRWRDRAEELSIERDRLRDALIFYATPVNYNDGAPGTWETSSGHPGNSGFEEVDFEWDDGHRARQALGLERCPKCDGTGVVDFGAGDVNPPGPAERLEVKCECCAGTGVVEAASSREER